MTKIGYSLSHRVEKSLARINCLLACVSAFTDWSKSITIST